MENDRQVLVAILFARILETFRALLSTLEGGHTHAGRILARSLLEATFALVALVRREETLERYVATGECDRLSWVNQLLDSLTLRVPGLPRSRLRAIKREIEADISKYDLEKMKINTEDLARWAKMHDSYLREYALWSLTVHASERDFRHHLVVGPAGRIEEVDLHRRPDEAVPLLSASALNLLRAHEALAELWGFDTGSSEAEYKRLFEVLGVGPLPGEVNDDQGDEAT